MNPILIFSMFIIFNAQSVNKIPGKGQMVNRMLSKFSASQGGIVIFLIQSKGYSVTNINLSNKFIFSHNYYSYSLSSSSISFFYFLVLLAFIWTTNFFTVLKKYFDPCSSFYYSIYYYMFDTLIRRGFKIRMLFLNWWIWWVLLLRLEHVICKNIIIFFEMIL